MASSRILCVRTSNRDSDDCVVIQIQSQGGEPLDLAIYGSEGENPYKSFVKQDQVSKLRAKNYKGDEPEWNAVLRHALLGEEQDAKYWKLLQSVELVSQMSTSRQILLNLRQSVPVDGGRPIIQLLGSLVLDRDDDLEMSIFDWAATAAKAAAEAQHQCASLKAQVDSSQKALSQSRTQLEDLVKTKTAHEDHLLEKLRHLLNTKKLKIRDQQRLLAGAQVDLSTAAQVKNARSITSGAQRQPLPRGYKRKASAVTEGPSAIQPKREQESLESPSHEHDFEDDDLIRTPETSQAENSGEEDDFEPVQTTAPSQSFKTTSTAREDQAAEKMDLSQDIPPPRALPTSMKAGKKPSPQSKSAEEEDEETDDEL